MMDNTTKRMTASEREALIRLAVVADILDEARAGLEQRSGMIPGARRDIAMMRTKSERLLERFEATIPPEQVDIYRRNINMCGYSVGVKSPYNRVQRDIYGMWLSFDVIRTLVAGLHDMCQLCDMDRAERRACPLRKALDTIPNDCPGNGDDCPYYGVV